MAEHSGGRSYQQCGAEFDWQAAGGRRAVAPCIKPAGHENGPDTDWKRNFHSNGMFKWPVGTTSAAAPDTTEES
jgi:hypothetical protein